jgi:hypothetical protein
LSTASWTSIRSAWRATAGSEWFLRQVAK